MCEESRCDTDGCVRGVGVTGSSQAGISGFARVGHNGGGLGGDRAQDAGSTISPHLTSCPLEALWVTGPGHLPP